MTSPRAEQSEIRAGMSLLDLLHARYPAADGWIAFEELTLRDTGTERRADFVALNTWASKRRLVVCEIKVARADWRRELDAPEKRAPWVEAASEFWVVAPKGIVPVSEVPVGIGLMEAIGDGSTLRATVRPKQDTRKKVPDQVLWRILNRWRDEKARNDAEKARMRGEVWFDWCGQKITLEQLRLLASKYSAWRERSPAKGKDHKAIGRSFENVIRELKWAAGDSPEAALAWIRKQKDIDRAVGAMRTAIEAIDRTDPRERTA